MINVFIGWDPTETEAWHVLAHSIYKRASEPVAIAPVKRSLFKNFYSRERGEYESTEFSMTRFLVPWLSHYRGVSVFLDCDMLVLGDIAELVSKHDFRNPVSVVKVDHSPTSSTKMLGAKQTQYPMKNWSSVMVFSNELCLDLTPEYVESAPGLELHRFQWLRDYQRIGSLPLEWNHLVGYHPTVPVEQVKLLHWTEGGPWWSQYTNADYSDVWFQERTEMRYGA